MRTKHISFKDDKKQIILKFVGKKILNININSNKRFTISRNEIFNEITIKDFRTYLVNLVYIQYQQNICKSAYIYSLVTEFYINDYRYFINNKDKETNDILNNIIKSKHKK